MTSASAPQAVVQVEDITTGYGNTVVLQNVSLTVQQGDIFVIAGPSGCGKTTLLKTMVGVQSPFSGRVLIEGQNLLAAEARQKMRLTNRIGVMFQALGLFSNLTVLENVRLPLEEFTELTDKAMDMAAMLKLRLVGVADAARQMPADLSGGMQKRVALARAAAMDPSILFLDEPSEGLDPVASGQLDRLIVDLSQNLDTTFVIISHKLSTIFHVADRAALFHEEEKGVIARGKPARLRDEAEDPRVRTFFRSDVEASEP